ncbi:hypothetical protein [Mesorhizobium sp. L2C066B000]|uniref:hypothetical protein n=1 Tax=unclassified Mesorhizobium TaxID=325217 RepID=UPI0012DFB3EE|nr:hypothetical protein [Mesorhizobium sp. L2C066B000]
MSLLVIRPALLAILWATGENPWPISLTLLSCRRLLQAWAVHRFAETSNRFILCFHAIPDGKPFHTFLELLLQNR